MLHLTDKELKRLVHHDFDGIDLFYDRINKEIISTPDEPDADRYEPIYELSYSEHLSTMEAFVEQLPEGKDKEDLRKRLRADVTYSEFNEAVGLTRYKADWHAFSQEMLTARFRREIALSLGLEEDEDIDDDVTNDVSAFDDAVYDVDADRDDQPFEFDWMEREYGIKLSDGNVRGTAPEVLALRESLTEEDLKNPGPHIKSLEVMVERYPNDPKIAMELAGLYAMTGKELKCRRIMERVVRDHSDNIAVIIGQAMSIEDPDTFMREVNKLQQPLDIRNYPAGEGGAYHALEFLDFEEMAIRAALDANDLTRAVMRLDRLVRFGFLHGDVEEITIGVCLLQIDAVREVHAGNPNPYEATEWTGETDITERTQAIIDATMHIALDIYKRAEAQHPVATVKRLKPKVGRNAPCPCGSGKKHKQCCLKK